MKKTILISVLAAMAFVFCGGKPVDEAGAQKVFERAMELGIAKGKKCFGAAIDESLHKDAAKELGVSFSGYARFIKNEDNKKLIGQWTLACMQKNK